MHMYKQLDKCMKLTWLSFSVKSDIVFFLKWIEMLKKSKGQLILKGLFCAFNSSKKTNNLRYHSTVWSNYFVRFWKNSGYQQVLSKLTDLQSSQCLHQRTQASLRVYSRLVLEWGRREGLRTMQKCSGILRRTQNLKKKIQSYSTLYVTPKLGDFFKFQQPSQNY